MSNYCFNVFAVDCRVNWITVSRELNHVAVRKQSCPLQWNFYEDCINFKLLYFYNLVVL